MTDIKSALSNVLNQWDAHENEIRKQPKEKEIMTTKIVAHRFKPTNNASRETFNAVRDFPNQKVAFYVEMLTKKKFKPTTVQALLYQMVKQGQMVKAADGCLVTTSNSYAPVKTTRKSKDVKPDINVVRELIANVDKPNKPSKSMAVSVGIAALNSDTAQEAKPKTSLILNRAWTPEKAIENLNVMQARALYDKLKTIFGG